MIKRKKEKKFALFIEILTFHNKNLITGLALSHAGVSLQSATGKGNSAVVQTTPSTEGIAHIVSQHTPLSGLTPIVTPMAVVSQGNQVTAHILAPSSLAGKMITTPILKSVGPLVNAQYINTTALVKPVVVVSSPSSNSSPTLATTSCTQPSSTSHSSVWQNFVKTSHAWNKAKSHIILNIGCKRDSHFSVCNYCHIDDDDSDHSHCDKKLINSNDYSASGCGCTFFNNYHQSFEMK